MELDFALYVITDRRLSQGRSHQEVASAAIAGGAHVIQFRDKEMSARELIQVGEELRELTKKAGVPFIINDRVDVALAVEADGVHLGQEDMPIKLARRLLGEGKIIGVSATSLAEALEAEAEGADYLGVGPIFATDTKPDAAPPTGLEGLTEVVRRVSIPVVAIGGINRDNVEEVMAAGAAGVAVISAVVAKEDIRQATSELLAKILEAKRRLGSADL